MACNCQVWVKKTDPVHPPTAAWTRTPMHVCITFYLLLMCQSNACMSYKQTSTGVISASKSKMNLQSAFSDMPDNISDIWGIKELSVNTGGVDAFSGVFDETKILWGMVLAAFTQGRPNMSWLRIQEKLICGWLLPRLSQVLLTLKCLYAFKDNKLLGLHMW